MSAIAEYALSDIAERANALIDGPTTSNPPGSSRIPGDPGSRTERPRAATSPHVSSANRPRSTNPTVAIVHEWLEIYGGSERVLEQLLRCFPDADLFAVVDFIPTEAREFLQGCRVHTTFIQRLPFARRMFRNYLGIMPLAIQQLDLSKYDFVISSSHAVAKGVITGPDQVHISYVHSPVRYAWDLQHRYLAQANLQQGIRGTYARWLFSRLREWDALSSYQVDHFIANSEYIARRIRKAYRRSATVIYPPVDVDRFVPGGEKEDFFLLACRFVPYKCVDIVVESFRMQPHRRLVVVGDGPDRARVHKAALEAPNIQFKGVLAQTELINLMQRARAFVFAGEEDFGITLVEAQACNTPVIAYGRGGAADIVLPEDTGHPTGVLFDRQDPSAIIEAVEHFIKLEPDLAGDVCRRNALRFAPERFRSEIRAFVCGIMNGLPEEDAAKLSVLQRAA